MKLLYGGGRHYFSRNRGGKWTKEPVAANFSFALRLKPAVPEVTAVYPAQCSILGGCRVTLRGKALGVQNSDVVRVTLKGAECTEVAVNRGTQAALA